MTALTDSAPERRQHLVYAGFAVVVLVYLFYSSFGLLGDFNWGHHGYHGAIYTMRARMSLRLHTIYPITWSGWERGPLAALYFHHPIGHHHLLTLLIPIFGDGEALARLVGVLTGLWSGIVIFQLGRRYWSPELGLAAMAIYLGSPFLASLSVLCDPMYLEMGAVLLGLDAFLRLLDPKEPKEDVRRQLWRAALWSAFGAFFMWEVFVVAPLIFGLGLVLRFLPAGRGLPKLGRLHRFDAHTLAVGSALGLMLAFHFFLTWKSGALAEMSESYRARAGTPVTMRALFASQWRWSMFLHGWPPFALGGLWLVGLLVRLGRGQARGRDLFALVPLVVNLIYIVLFPGGVMVHLYRVYFFAGFFPFAIIDLVSETLELLRRAATSPTVRAGVGAGLVLGFLAVQAPHVYRNVLESRVVMGTHGEPRYDPHREQHQFAKEVHARTSQADRVIIHYGHLGARKEFWYYLDRTFDEIRHLAELDRLKATHSQSVLILDERRLMAGEHAIFDELVRHHPVTFFGPFVMIDLRRDGAGITAYELVPGPMSPSYRFFYSHVYPPLRAEKRPLPRAEALARRLGLPYAE